MNSVATKIIADRRKCWPLKCAFLESAKQILLIGILIVVTGCNPKFTDISPNGSVPTTAGLTIALAGNDASLFAVSLNAGVWQRTLSAGGTRHWSQLNGPRYAFSIAVDAAHPMHIAVGERNGDATEVRLNEAGLWESFDGGSTWTYSLNPLALPDPNSGSGALCSSQVVRSIVFTSNSTLIAATACGIARKEQGAAEFVPANLPAWGAPCSALAVSATKVWARTFDGRLLVSVDDGKNFDFATTKPLPQGVNFYTIRGDEYSLAASDSVVLMSGCCADSGPAPVNGHPANELIIYRATDDTFTVEPMFDAAGKTITEGTYVGGQRFVRSFNTPKGVRFFFCNGQAVWEIGLTGTPRVKATLRVNTLIASSGVDVTPPEDPYAGGIHTDLWDFALDPSGSAMWIACDGGVYENRLDGSGWKATVDGLHTQHVQALNVNLDPAGTHVVYGTQDNAAWSGGWPNWRQVGPGDVNWCDADAGGAHQAFLFRSFTAFDLVGLDGVSPSFSSGATPTSILADPRQPDRPGLIQFIQSVKGESGVPFDAFTVVHRPVLDQEDPPKPIVPPPALSGIEQSGNPWLLRNRKWSSEPDFYRGIAQGNWEAELKDLPDGVERVLASGGHADPHYFAIVREPSGLLSLYERRFERGKKGNEWIKIFEGIIDWTSHCEVWEGSYGPVFVNPYDLSKIFLLAPDGVKVSRRNASHNLVFEDDKILTNLITASSTYPIVRQFCGGNPRDVIKAFRTLGTNTLGQVSFSRDDPGETIVASPFTGVFYNSGDGVWRSFANLLPSGEVWAVGLDADNAYIGFAGRSVGFVNRRGSAPLATYFVRAQENPPPKPGSQPMAIVAKLLTSTGPVVSNKIVSVRICSPTGKTIFLATILHLDGQGEVQVPRFAAAPGSVIHIHFVGVDGLASSEFHFAY